MKVLVFGGTGWVGHHIVRAFHSAGHDVAICSRGRKATYESETPNWMIWFAGSSSEKKDFSWLYRPSFWKLTSLMLVGCAVLGCGIAWALRDSDAFLAFLICVVAIWLIGVLLVERHFRRHYTPKQTS